MPETTRSEIRDSDTQLNENLRSEGLGSGSGGKNAMGSFNGGYKSLSPARLWISSRTSSLRAPPGVSPSSLLESPVLLTHVKAEPSPTTGSFVMPFHGKSGFGLKRSFSPRDVPSSIIHDDGNITHDCTDSSPSLSGTEVCTEEQKTDTLSMNSGNINLIADSTEIEEHVTDEIEMEMNQKENDHVAVNERETDDGYNWRKYGQKLVKGSEFPRSYYKCTHLNCPVKKILERNFNGQIVDVINRGEHNHPKPIPIRRLPVGLSHCSKAKIPYLQGQDIEANIIFSGEGDVEESSLEPYENLDDFVDNDPDMKRRRKEELSSDLSGMPKTILPRVVVQTLSEIDILDDGYRWRKYGQKVVKGNPNPRSYYKCTNTGCPVRKHVERASNDPKAVITTYEGKHNHDVPAPSRPNYESNLIPTHFGTMGPAGHIRYEQMEENTGTGCWGLLGSVSLDLGVGLSQVPAGGPFNGQSQLQNQTRENLEISGPGFSSSGTFQNFNGNLSLGTKTTAERFTFRAPPLFNNPPCEASLRRMLMGRQVP